MALCVANNFRHSRDLTVYKVKWPTLPNESPTRWKFECIHFVISFVEKVSSANNKALLRPSHESWWSRRVTSKALTVRNGPVTENGRQDNCVKF